MYCIGAACLFQDRESDLSSGRIPSTRELVSPSALAVHRRSQRVTWVSFVLVPFISDKQIKDTRAAARNLRLSQPTRLKATREHYQDPSSADLHATTQSQRKISNRN